MFKRILTVACAAAALTAPVAANAQHGHGGGLHGGGFHGGGGYGGGFHGGYGGYGGWHGGYGWRGGYGAYPYWGFGLGLGLGALWAYDAPYSYYPEGWAYGPYGYYTYGYEDGGYGYGYGGSTSGPAPPVADAWSNEAAAERGASSAGVATPSCGRWVWRANQNRYTWDGSGC